MIPTSASLAIYRSLRNDARSTTRWYTPVSPSRSKTGNVDSVVWQLNSSSHTAWDAPSRAA